MTRRSRSPLPIVVPGMRVFDHRQCVKGVVVAVTPDRCVFREADQPSQLMVSPWSHIALLDVGPDEEALPAALEERDRRNAWAFVLKELVYLEQYDRSSIVRGMKDYLLSKLRRRHT
ncbi:hypothetical protein ACERK3_13775 [Phycisphaerales bacterium AB-hyl4]|uniref:Uncharacterized protein n=1 Tax=Natronomicrosphaera hydrolytica TaxID=3242702 RepID=A0ABV4U979_9BACT